MQRRIRNVIIMLCFIGLASMFVASYFSDHALGYSQFSPHSQFADWDARREEVKEAFVISWDAYKKHAWGEFCCILQ